MKRLLGHTTALAWMVVAVVGLFVLILVPAIHLPSRLRGGQDLLDDAAPAFTAPRVAGDRAGISMVSSIVDLADPIVTADGGAADEVPQLISFVSSQTGLSEADVVSALAEHAPKTTALLQALPLSDVTAELPGLVSFLGDTLGLSPDQVQQALGENFPRLSQSIGALPTVTDGWQSVPGTESLTRFDGSQVSSVPQVRDYFAGDVIPVLERQQGNFRDLDSGFPSVGLIPGILLALAGIVIVFALVMTVRTWSGEHLVNEAAATWGVVVAVGVVVVILGALLFPRLRGGQDLLDDAAPAFTAPRVAGDRAGISMVSSIVDLADPIVTADGGAADEVPQLISFVSSQTGLSEADVVSALAEHAPKTTALLQALPLSDVTAELPGLVSFLGDTLGLSPDQVQQALGENFPRLSQSIGALPTVTDGWQSVPGTESLTRFDGSQVSSVPQVRDYFAGDVIPVLERQQGNFDTLATTPPKADFFAPFLVLVGILVIAYGGAMIAIVRFRRPPFPHRPVLLRTA